MDHFINQETKKEISSTHNKKQNGEEGDAERCEKIKRKIYEYSSLTQFLNTSYSPISSSTSLYCFWYFIEMMEETVRDIQVYKRHHLVKKYNIYHPMNIQNNQVS